MRRCAAGSPAHALEQKWLAPQRNARNSVKLLSRMRLLWWVMSVPVAAGHDPRHGRWFRESSVTPMGATLHNQVQITSTRDRDHVVAAVRSPRCMYGHVAGAQV